MQFDFLVSDISRQSDVDAIVNSANRNLRRGSGVSGAIHDAAGPEMEHYLVPFAPLAFGSAMVSPGFQLQTPWVIHACASSLLHEDQATEHLFQAVYETLKIASAKGFNRLALPAMGTGIFRFSPALSAELMRSAFHAAADHGLRIPYVRFCFSNCEVLEVFQASWVEKTPRLFERRGLCQCA